MKTGANKGFTYDLIHTNTIQTKLLKCQFLHIHM